MQKLDRALLAQLLPQLLAGACPSTVPRSGSTGEQVNCFTTTVREGEEPNLVLLRIVGRQVEGLKFDGQKYSIDVSIPLSDIDPAKLHLTHFYGLDEVRYEGVWAIARARWTQWPYAWIHLRRIRNAIAQWLFNRRNLASRRRLETLREVLEATTNGADGVDAMDLMSARYGYRWASHPEWEAHHRQLEQTLDLLVESGDLRQSQHRFQPTGQALRTLDESDEADRKHTANVRVQILIALLTLISAAMAAAQAGLIKFPVLVDLTSKATAEPIQCIPAAPVCPASASTSASAARPASAQPETK